MTLLKLFGSPELKYESKSQLLPLNTPSSLLFYLAVKGSWVSRSELAFLYRPDETEKEALRYLRLQLHRAQQYDWAGSLEVEQQQLRWLIATDIHSFQTAIKAQSWSEAISLYQDSFFAKHSLNFPTYNTWLELEREQLEQAYRLALSQQIESFSTQTEFEAAALLAEKLWGLDQFDEAHLQTYLYFLAKSNQNARAVQQYSEFSSALKEDLGLEPLEETKALIEQIKANELSLPAKPLSAKHNLPNQSTYFVGRSKELDKLKKQFKQASCRLVSLVGLGGSGKTRLSLEFAWQSLTSFKDGVYFVPLANLSHVDQVATSVAQALGLTLEPDQIVLNQLSSYLADKNLLLVLDNFEHVLAAKTLIIDLLKTSTYLKILVTSRESLKLQSEWLFDVQGLSFPEDDRVSESFEAVQLFITAAQRIEPRLSLDQKQMKQIALIARHVQGLPLALELAASWLRIMPLERIAKELSQGYDLLKTDSADIPERQRSLESILDATWQKLSEQKREALAQFSVFAESCDLAAVEQICNIPFSLFLSLVNEALIQKQASQRFKMHPLVKRYSSFKLNQVPQLKEVTLQRYSLYYIKQLPSDGSSMHLEELQTNIQNIRSSWQHLLKQETLDEIERSFNSLEYLHSMTGRYEEASQLWDLTQTQLQNLSPSPQRDRLLGLTLNAKADRLIPLGELALAESYLEKSFALLSEQKAAKELAYVLSSFARLNWLKGNQAKAQVYLEQALAAVQGLGEQRQEINILHGLALVLREQGKLSEALTYYQNVIEAYLARNELGNAAMALNNLASLRLSMHQIKEAQEAIKEGQALIKGKGAKRAETFLKLSYATTLYSLKSYQEALLAFQEGLSLAENIHDQTLICEGLTMLGNCYLALNQNSKAKQQLIKAMTLSWQAQLLPKVLAACLSYANLLLHQDNPQDALALLTHIVKHPAARVEHKQEATELMAKLEKQLGSAFSKAAKDFAETPLELLITKLIAQHIA